MNCNKPKQNFVYFVYFYKCNVIDLIKKMTFITIIRTTLAKILHIMKIRIRSVPNMCFRPIPYKILLKYFIRIITCIQN